MELNKYTVIGNKPINIRLNDIAIIAVIIVHIAECKNKFELRI